MYSYTIRYTFSNNRVDWPKPTLSHIRQYIRCQEFDRFILLRQFLLKMGVIGKAKNRDFGFRIGFSEGKSDSLEVNLMIFFWYFSANYQVTNFFYGFQIIYIDYVELSKIKKGTDLFSNKTKFKN